jgi:adenine-specific DNA-methyltransferase
MSANSKNKEEAYNGIKELVEKFKSNYKQFHSSDYNETLTRQDFINPFFEYLGWDISNKEGLSQTYRDVIHEDKLKVGRDTTLTAGIRQSPDYSFRIGGNRVFFVEAKKPSRNLKEDADAAYQIRRYAWSGKLSVSILTDFEEFAIYDCSKKPSPNDKASMSRIEYINYEDYLNRFDFLYDTFAKENVLRGSLEKYNVDTKSKKGTESVDIDFLNSLDDLRTKLASNISKLNSLSLRDLNFAVQHIIDRIIFLRVAEDRGVENYGDLREACCRNNYYKNIVEIFKKADGKYNSGIFDFSKDKITQNIEVDNKVIKEIINDLYYPKSPYEFSVISVEIIGNAYEQFLGKTITIGKNSKAKIELKP